MAQRTAWIWIVGCCAWIFDGMLAWHFHAYARAELAFLVAALFFMAWWYYSRQPRK